MKYDMPYYTPEEHETFLTVRQFFSALQLNGPWHPKQLARWLAVWGISYRSYWEDSNLGGAYSDEAVLKYTRENLDVFKPISKQDIEWIETKAKTLEDEEDIEQDDAEFGTVDEFQKKSRENLDKIKQLLAKHPNNEDVVCWYLRLARVQEPDAAVAFIENSQEYFCESYLSLVCIYMDKNQMSEAENALDTAKQLWPNSVLVKCVEVALLIKLYGETGIASLMEEAKKILDGLGPSDEKFETLAIESEKELWKNVDRGEVPSIGTYSTLYKLFGIHFGSRCAD